MMLNRACLGLVWVQLEADHCIQATDLRQALISQPSISVQVQLDTDIRQHRFSQPFNVPFFDTNGRVLERSLDGPPSSCSAHLGLARCCGESFLCQSLDQQKGSILSRSLCLPLPRPPGIARIRQDGQALVAWVARAGEHGTTFRRYACSSSPNPAAHNGKGSCFFSFDPCARAPVRVSLPSSCCFRNGLLGCGSGLKQ